MWNVGEQDANVSLAEEKKEVAAVLRENQMEQAEDKWVALLVIGIVVAVPLPGCPLRKHQEGAVSVNLAVAVAVADRKMGLLVEAKEQEEGYAAERKTRLVVGVEEEDGPVAVAVAVAGAGAGRKRQLPSALGIQTYAVPDVHHHGRPYLYAMTLVQG